jgi:hypothetical protein
MLVWRKPGRAVAGGPFPLVRVGRVEQHHPHHLVRVQVGECPHEQAAERVPDDHIGPLHARAPQRRAELAGQRVGVVGPAARLAPAEAGAVVADDARLLRQFRLDPRPVGRHAAQARFEDHRRAVWRRLPGDPYVQAKAARIDQPTGAGCARRSDSAAIAWYPRPPIARTTTSAASAPNACCARPGPAGPFGAGFLKLRAGPAGAPGTWWPTAAVVMVVHPYEKSDSALPPAPPSLAQPRVDRRPPVG